MDSNSNGPLRGCGLAVLVAALPLALSAAIMSANEYRGWGLDAVDCDGSVHILIFALPAMAIYGVAAVVNGRQFRNRLNLFVAILSLSICLGLAFKMKQAVDENRRNAAIGACR